MRRAPLPMPAFTGSGITSPQFGPPTLSVAEQLEAATVAARETAADRERLVLENAQLRAEIELLKQGRANA